MKSKTFWAQEQPLAELKWCKMYSRRQRLNTNVTSSPPFFTKLSTFSNHGYKLPNLGLEPPNLGYKFQKYSSSSRTSRGRKFRKKKELYYIAKKQFAHRMRARRPSARCPNHFFAVNELSAVPRWYGRPVGLEPLQQDIFFKVASYRNGSTDERNKANQQQQQNTRV